MRELSAAEMEAVSAGAAPVDVGSIIKGAGEIIVGVGQIVGGNVVGGVVSIAVGVAEIRADIH
jgi:hypothetical protein